MTTPVLFAATILIWGTTWIAIAAQVGAVPVAVSVFYRFALAGVLMLAVLAALDRLRSPAVWGRALDPLRSPCVTSGCHNRLRYIV